MKPTRPLGITVDGTSYLIGYEPAEYTPDELAAMPYNRYLRTAAWRERRRRTIIEAEYRCERCGRYGRYEGQLHVHHLTYERRGNEHPDDLMVLCENCHRAVHRS